MPNKRQQAQSDRKATVEVRRAEVNALTINYKSAQSDPAFQDLLVKCRQFADYHLKLAQDGVGYKVDSDGKQSEVEFSPQQRTSHLDKAAGIQEILDYVDRQIAKGLPKSGETDGLTSS